MCREIRILLRRRDRAWKRYKRTGSVEHQQLFKDLRRQVTARIRQTKREYIDRLNSRLEDPTCPPKEYWRLVRSVYGNKTLSSIPPITNEGVAIAAAESKAELFNTYFVQQSTLPSPPDGFALSPQGPPPPHTLDLIQTDVTEVLKILQSLNTSKANGPDYLRKQAGAQ